MILYRVMGYAPEIVTEADRQEFIEYFLGGVFQAIDFNETIKGGYWHGMIVWRGSERLLVKGRELVEYPEGVTNA